MRGLVLGHSRSKVAICDGHQCILAAPFLTQLPANSLEDAVEDGSHVGALPLMSKTGMKLLASAGSGPGHRHHVWSEPVDGCFVSLIFIK